MIFVTKKPQQSTTKESKTSKTLSLPISTWAQMEQIRSKKGYKDFEETIIKIFSEQYVSLGFGFAP